MDLYYERKIEINEWLITTRWFYMVAVFLIGILGNSLISLFAVEFSFLSVAILLVAFIFVNFYFHYTLKQIKKTNSERRLKILSVAQIAIELLLFTIIMRLGGDKSIASVFYFLPIISASIIFGLRGAVITAVVSAVLVNLSAVLDYFSFLNINIFFDGGFNVLDVSELRYQTIALIKIITTSNFYLVLAIFLGYGSKILSRREQWLIARAEKLGEEKDLKAREAAELDKEAKVLSEQDRKLKETNQELNKKIKELEKSERSLIRAFSDLQEARNKTEEEKNKTAAIISNFVDPIIVIDKENKINFLNPAAKEIFGFIDADLGKEVLITNHHSMNNFSNIVNRKFQVKSSKALGAGNPNEEEVMVNFNNQELTYKVITARVIDGKNNYLGVMKIFYNLTREKIIDKLKSEFISIAAHQLRTPLSAIKWVIKMVLDGDAGKLNEEQEKLLFKGYQSNERIIALVNDMLNVSRIEDGRFGYSFKQDSFNDAVSGIVDSLSGIIKRKNIKFTLKKPAKIPSVYMDKQKIELVLQNLLENAVKYTPEYGKIEMGIELGDKLLRVRVEDNGVGIPDKDQEKLFSKFFRADNVIRMQTEGSGLGLFIAKNIIKKHGGEISCVSREGKGTKFVFTLPIA